MSEEEKEDEDEEEGVFPAHLPVGRCCCTYNLLYSIISSLVIVSVRGSIFLPLWAYGRGQEELAVEGQMWSQCAETEAVFVLPQVATESRRSSTL